MIKTILNALQVDSTIKNKKSSHQVDGTINYS